MSESKVLKLENDYLEEVINMSSSKVVGKIMKRFEIIENKESLKRNVKELIYEGFRDFRDILIAHDRGLNIAIFKFKTKIKKENLTQN